MRGPVGPRTRMTGDAPEAAIAEAMSCMSESPMLPAPCQPEAIKIWVGRVVEVS